MKKKVPLDLLQALQPSANPNLRFAKIVKDPNSIVLLIDKEEESDYYFKIARGENRQGVFNYYIEMMPKTVNLLKKHETWCPIDVVIKYLTKWLSILESYSEVEDIFEDPIIRQYQKNFEDQFKIVDNGADFYGFNLDQQMYLKIYLEETKSKFVQLVNGRSTEEIIIIEEIFEEINEAQTNLTKETKNQIIKRLSKIWAKSQKIGLEVLREVFVNVASQIMTRLLGI